MAILKINGAALPNPSAYSVILADFDSQNSTRSAKNARLKRQRIRARAYKISVGWTNISKPTLKSITDKIKNAEFLVTFFNPTESSDTTATMMVGDRTGELSSYTDEDKPNESYWNLSFEIVEY